jgi:iron only hydrogenase large subunit-like protein
MQPKDQNRDFHHALRVYRDICTGCTHCMTVCPTKAIRVKQGKAMILVNRCVDCGECYKACPVSAIGVEQDDLQMIFRFPVRVLLIPSVLVGQISHKVPVENIYRALREVGFTHVYHAENTVDMVLEAYDKYAGTTKLRPMISSFCPAIVRLIQVRFPSLVENIIKVNPPIDMSALYYLEKLNSEGIPKENIGLFYATPCAAKIAAIKSPVGETESAVTGVINMDFLYNKIQKILQKQATDSELPITDNLLSSRGIMWSLTRGESAHWKKRALAIDGIKNVTEILESVENDKLGVADFLEVRACDESCAGGILMSGNRFLTVERLRKLASDHAATGNDDNKKLADGFINLKEHSFLGNIEPRNIEKLDENLTEAMKKMERKRKMMGFLPGFDCAACGAPDCQALSEDIVKGDGNLTDCIFMQQKMMNENTMSLNESVSITSKIWGKHRLDKYSSKTGKQDEDI